MSINQAIGNAISGLGASSRASEIVSRNVANATTPGYSATALARSQRISGVEGHGVRVDGVERAGNPLLTADRRRIEAGAARAETDADIQRRLADMLTDPDGGDSLAGRFTALDTALRNLADTPESPALQEAAAAAGRAIAKRFNTLSTEASRMRGDLETDIRRQVDTVNVALRKIAQLNTSIASAASAGKDTTALEDERDRQIEVVNGLVPIRATPRDNGGMVIASAGGTLLVEGSARLLTLDSDMNIVIGADPERGHPGLPASAEPPSGILRGGMLEALYTGLRETVPAFEAEIETMARDLVDRFQSLDGYLEADGDGAPLAGLFTVADGGDRGRMPDGFAGSAAASIRLNAAIDPEQGGRASGLVTGREGLIAPDPDADPRPLPFPRALVSALGAARDSPLGTIAGRFAAADLAIAVTARRESVAQGREGEASFQRAATLGLRERELAASAVDTDAELQNLLRIEQAYAANARVLQTVNDMINRLLEI